MKKNYLDKNFKNVNVKNLNNKSMVYFMTDKKFFMFDVFS